jgi:hypothetical protein
MEETAGKVMGVAEEVYETAREKSGEVIEEVREAARERSREEGLTAEGVMKAAARPAQAAQRETER